jgi:hypothetical protein
VPGLPRFTVCRWKAPLVLENVRMKPTSRSRPVVFRYDKTLSKPCPFRSRVSRPRGRFHALLTEFEISSSSSVQAYLDPTSSIIFDRFVLPLMLARGRTLAPFDTLHPIQLAAVVRPYATLHRLTAIVALLGPSEKVGCRLTVFSLRFRLSTRRLK